jgi:hypothetical protein
MPIKNNKLTAIPTTYNDVLFPPSDSGLHNVLVPPIDDVPAAHAIHPSVAVVADALAVD